MRRWRDGPGHHHRTCLTFPNWGNSSDAPWCREASAAVTFVPPSTSRGAQLRKVLPDTFPIDSESRHDQSAARLSRRFPHRHVSGHVVAHAVPRQRGHPRRLLGRVAAGNPDLGPPRWPLRSRVLKRAISSREGGLTGTSRWRERTGTVLPVVLVLVAGGAPGAVAADGAGSEAPHAATASPVTRTTTAEGRNAITGSSPANVSRA